MESIKVFKNRKIINVSLVMFFVATMMWMALRNGYKMEYSIIQNMVFGTIGSVAILNNKRR